MIKIEIRREVSLAEIPQRTLNAHSGQVSTLQLGVYNILGFREFPAFQEGGQPWYGLLVADAIGNEIAVSFGDLRGTTRTYIDDVRRDYYVSSPLFKNINEIDDYMKTHKQIEVVGFENLPVTRYGEQVERTKRVPLFKAVEPKAK